MTIGNWIVDKIKRNPMCLILPLAGALLTLLLCAVTVCAGGHEGRMWIPVVAALVVFVGLAIEELPKKK